ncbi:hypothetical protein BDZ89DRAFT_219054 [Hymenopellis radicata]|nr:hypothetical protein BDZ89DRAFT_219054 [Hymenopellis radicata]
MSAKDAATWLRVLLLGGKNPLTMAQVIPEAVIEMVATGVSVVTGKAEYPELSPAVYGGAQSRYSYRGHEIIEHGGSTTGFMSQIARFPSDGLGIAVFSNDDEYGGTLHTILKWYLADVALGLELIDWNGRMKKKVLENYTHESRPRPINPPSSSLPFSDLGGSYGNLGYGALELCLLDDPSATSQSASCAQVVADAPETLPGAINGSVPTFLAKWEKAWSTHIKLEHFAGIYST